MIKKFLKRCYGDFLYYRYKYLYNKNPRLAAISMYKKIYGKNSTLNIDEPKNLIEKITWMSLNTDTSLWTLCADKYRMRHYVEAKGLGNYLPKCYGFWENPNDIDFSQLPDQFVLKANNGCGTIMIIRNKNKVNENNVKRQMKKWLKRPFGYMGAQKHYLSIKPGILAEELLTQTKELDELSPNSMVDFKIWCFNGKPETILVTSCRDDNKHNVALYDLNWNPTPENLNSKYCEIQKKSPAIPRPKHLDEMINIAKKLSVGFKEIRVDLYDTDNKAVLGEMTFTAGYGSLNQNFYTYLGDKFDISDLK